MKGCGHQSNAPGWPFYRRIFLREPFPQNVDFADKARHRHANRRKQMPMKGALLKAVKD